MPDIERSSVDDFRRYLADRHGTDYGATDEQLRTLLDRGQAHRETLGYGSVFVMATGWLRETALGPDAR